VRREAGFTLAEMLVALAVTGLVAVVLFGALGQWRVSAAHAADADARFAEVVDAQRLLRLRIAALRPDKDPQNAGASLDLAGDGDGFEFTAPAPDRAGPDAPWRYRLRRAGDGALVLYGISTLSAAVDLHDPAVAGWQAVRLVPGTAGLAIAYFGNDPVTHAAGWQGAWSRRAALPRAVRIRVTFPAGDARVWPELDIAPRAATPESCTIDLTTGHCANDEAG